MKKLLLSLYAHNINNVSKAIDLFNQIATASNNQEVQIDFIMVGEAQLDFYKNSELFKCLENSTVKVVFMPEGQAFNSDSKINRDLLDPILDAARYDIYAHIAQRLDEGYTKICKEFAFDESKDLFIVKDEELDEQAKPITPNKPTLVMKEMRFYKYLTTKAKKVEFISLDGDTNLHKVYGIGKTMPIDNFAKSLYNLRK